MKRRHFVFGGAALGAGALLPACAGSAKPTRVAQLLPANASWQQVRDLFALRPDRVHMAGFLLVSHPRPVREAIEKHRRGFDEDPAGYLHDHWEPAERAIRSAAADYLGGHFDEVAMTDSTTMGLGLVYGGLELREGQEILTTTHDHIVTHLALEYRAARSGAPLRKVSLYDKPAAATIDEMAGRLERAITDKTRIIALTWVHSGTGVKLPIAELAKVVARANRGRADADRALLFVDGVHGFGNQPDTISELGCDVFIAGCHKWMFGPRGTGIVWAKKDVWPVTGPIIPSFDPAWRPEPLDRIPVAAYMTPGGFHSFEHRWALVEAFALHQKLGPARIADRIAELNSRCKRAMAEIAGVEVVTPMARDVSAGIICFQVAGKSVPEVIAAMNQRGVIATRTPEFYEPPYARLAPSLTTMEADVDRSIAALAEVAT